MTARTAPPAGGRATLRRATLLLLTLALALSTLTAATAQPDPAQPDPAPAPPGQPARPAADGGHEIWALDQGAGLDEIAIFDEDLQEVDRIPLGGLRADGAPDVPLVDTPHMIDFDSSNRYAFVASTRSGTVTVIRADDREVLAVIPTGAGAHMAAVTPDDSAVWVANIGAGTFSEIAIDLEAETFELSGRELVVKEDPLYDDADFPVPFTGPICHQFTPDGRFAYLTLGPGTGGLAVIDMETVSIHRIWPQSEVQANCGVAITADGQTAWSNWGVPSQEEGVLYRFDAVAHELVQTIPTRGVDAHGVRLTPDESQLWLVNRDSSNGIVVDTATNEVIHDLDRDVTGPVPDILAFSPSGDRVYVTLRGPNPRSGAHQTVGERPGIAVIDTATRTQIAILEPNAGNADSDFHGIEVRPTSGSADVTRIAGPTRIATAIEASRDAIADGTAGAAVLATAGDFPDALAGTPVAAALGGPVLLTPADGLPEEVAAELQRVLTDTGDVIVLGGEAAVSQAVVDAVEALGIDVRRVAGDTRYETAAQAARLVTDPAVQIITTGEGFADALAAGAAAAATGGVVVLTPSGRTDAATEAYLAEVPAPRRIAVGGPAAAAYPDVDPIVGADRVATSVLVATELLPDATTLAVASGETFADALAGGVAAAVRGAPLVLTASARLSPGLTDLVCDGGFGSAVVFGGEAALGGAVAEALANRLAGSGCGGADAAPAGATFASATAGAVQRNQAGAYWCHLTPGA